MNPLNKKHSLHPLFKNKKTRYFFWRFPVIILRFKKRIITICMWLIVNSEQKYGSSYTLPPNYYQGACDNPEVSVTHSTQSGSVNILIWEIQWEISCIHQTYLKETRKRWNDFKTMPWVESSILRTWIYDKAYGTSFSFLPMLLYLLVPHLIKKQFCEIRKGSID